MLDGKGVATVKWDGACCAIINGEFYKRYDAKKGKKPPEGAIPCQPEPDPITGHWPHWVKVDENNPADKWFMEAYKNSAATPVIPDGTYEAIGPHFQSNPYNLPDDILYAHGDWEVNMEQTFDGIRKYLKEHNVEGIVFWSKPKFFGGEPKCKIKRTDFGFPWPMR